MHSAKILFCLRVNSEMFYKIVFSNIENYLNKHFTLTVVLLVGQKCICPALIRDKPSP